MIKILVVYLLLCTAYATVNCNHNILELNWNDMLVKYSHPALVRTECEL